MNLSNILIPYYAGMTSILKIFALYILSKWYGITFGFPFLFLFFRIYKIIINKKYNISSLSLNDYFLLLKTLFFDKNNIKEIIIKSDESNTKGSIIKTIKEFINNNNIFKKKLIYKLNNYYWYKLNEEEINKQIIYNQECIENKINKKLNILKEPSYLFFIIDNKDKINNNNLKIVFKYNSLINQKYGEFLNDYLNGKNIKEIKNRKMNKYIKIVLEFLTFPIYIIFETLVILILLIKNI